MLSCPAIQIKYLPVVPTSIPKYPVIEMAQVVDQTTNQVLFKASLDSEQRGFCPGEQNEVGEARTRSKKKKKLKKSGQLDLSIEERERSRVVLPWYCLHYWTHCPPPVHAVNAILPLYGLLVCVIPTHPHANTHTHTSLAPSLCNNNKNNNSNKNNINPGEHKIEDSSTNPVLSSLFPLSQSFRPREMDRTFLFPLLASI